ncbi:MAG: type I-C CRISPR-associated protein Cas8c/Csd1 [Thiobacillus sp.]|nr:type I-C CRISPR-associated protein Cas8c/Csd1 [Thiobacillus sp.]
MLNELLQAANAIPSLPETLHKSLKTLPKTSAYKVLLGEQGDIVGVVPYPDPTQGLRKWQPGANGFSTPIFNSQPLYRIDPDKSLLDAARNADIASWAKTFGLFRARCADLGGSWIDIKRGELNEKCRKSLADVPAQLQSLLSKDDPDYAVLRALLERLQRLTPERFFPELARQLETQMESAYDEALFKLYCAASDAEAAKSCNLLLDLPDWDVIGDYPVTHERTTELLNALLTSAGSGSASATNTAPDAYGRAATGADEKFADVIVPGLGKVILRAMTKDAPCQYRYGKADANSFLVGKDSRERAKSALEYLTQAGRKGKTWQYRGGSLFLFYPEQELSVLNDSAIADLCSLPDDEDDAFAAVANKAATFEARAERIAAALEGKPRESEVPVHLIVLRKPDGHRTKLVAHHTFTMQHFVDSAKAWVDGAKTCPPVAFARWGKAKGERNDIVPEPPFPYQVTSWLNTFWVRGDENQGKFKTFSPEDALTLLLASDGTQTQMARRALRHALVGWAGFLIAAGAHEHASHASTVLKAGDKRAAALSSLPAILALLLFKSKSHLSREHIMASPAFLVGRLLALADSLHYQYCQGVRNGQVPGQLLGNALMQTALVSPKSALSIYGQRILPYQAWARTCKASGQGPETLAKYFLSQLGEICSEINLPDITEPISDADKAQIILGYLAKPSSQPQG